MLNIATEELLKNNLHHQKRQQRHKHTPAHAENSTLILLLEVTFNKLLEEKLILTNVFQIVAAYSNIMISRIISFLWHSFIRKVSGKVLWIRHAHS